MSHKRKATEISGSDQDATRFLKKSRPAYKPRGVHHKPRDRNPSQPTDEDSITKTSKIKSRIRDLKRLLEHADNEAKYKMPANVRIDRERELEALEHELAEKRAATQEAERRSKMIGKYHQVRFFDRKKAAQNLKKLEKELSTLDASERKPELEQMVHIAEVNLNYAMYYPLMKPYFSMFPKNKQDAKEQTDLQESADEDGASQTGGFDTNLGAKGDPQMWRAVEQAMKDGTLDELRNSNPDKVVTERREDASRLSSEKKKKDKKTGHTGDSQARPKAKRKGAAQEENEDDESDGGFFE